MNTIENYMQTAQSFITTNYPTKLAMGMAAVPALAATECAIRAIGNLVELIFSDEQKKETGRNDFGANLGGAIFYGMCAAHVIPGSHIIGAAIFTIYSIKKCDTENAYFAAQLIGKPIKAFCEKVLPPVLDKVFTIAMNLFSTLNHPVWIGVVTLGVATLAYRTFLAPATKVPFTPFICGSDLPRIRQLLQKN